MEKQNLTDKQIFEWLEVRYNKDCKIFWRREFHWYAIVAAAVCGMVVVLVDLKFVQELGIQEWQFGILMWFACMGVIIPLVHPDRPTWEDARRISLSRRNQLAEKDTQGNS